MRGSSVCPRGDSRSDRSRLFPKSGTDAGASQRHHHRRRGMQATRSTRRGSPRGKLGAGASLDLPVRNLMLRVRAHKACGRFFSSRLRWRILGEATCVWSVVQTTLRRKDVSPWPFIVWRIRAIDQMGCSSSVFHLPLACCVVGVGSRISRTLERVLRGQRWPVSTV
jgi:hypothetical protein